MYKILKKAANDLTNLIPKSHQGQTVYQHSTVELNVSKNLFVLMP